MADEIKAKLIGKAAFTITLASLANGTGRQSTMVDNSGSYPAALVYVRLKGVATPTAGSVYEVYLLRGDALAADTPVYRSDGAGASDAAFTPLNAIPLGVIVVTAAVGPFYGEFDTSWLGPLGPQWGIAIKNSSGAALSATGGDHLAEWVYYVPEIQG